MTDETAPEAEAAPTYPEGWTPPTVGRNVHFFLAKPAAGAESPQPFHANVACVHDAGPEGCLNLGVLNENGAPLSKTSIQHIDHAAVGAPCWDWPARV